MSYSLIAHPQKYDFSPSGIVASCGSFSGLALAKRHWELSNIDVEHKAGHRLIALLEFCPVLGAIAALIEAIVVSIFKNLYQFQEDKLIHSIERRYPPTSLCDTMILDDEGDERSKHGQGKLFDDAEIVQIHSFVKKSSVEEQDPFVNYTENGRAVIQQQAIRGCTAAAAAMLIVDYHKRCDISVLRNTNLGDTSTMCQLIQEAGLNIIVHSIQSLEALRALLNQGPAIINIDQDIGSHVIVVDELTKEHARVRDPYHGWQVTVKRSAVERQFNGSDVIQILQY